MRVGESNSADYNIMCTLMFLLAKLEEVMESGKHV